MREDQLRLIRKREYQRILNTEILVSPSRFLLGPCCTRKQRPKSRCRNGLRHFILSPHGFKHRESLSDHYYFHGDFHDAYLLSQDLGNARPDITLGESTRSLAASSFRKFENMATYLQDQFLGCLR